MQRGDENYQWVLNNPRRKALFLSFTRPMTKSEIESRVSALTDVNCKGSIKLKEYIGRNLITFINPGIREGRVYSLSETGRQIAESIAEKNKFKWHFDEPVIDWNLYGSVVCGRRKRQLLQDIVGKGRITTLSNRYRAGIETIKGTGRSYKYEVLNDFLKTGLVKKVLERGVPLYLPTEKAKKIFSVICER